MRVLKVLGPWVYCRRLILVRETIARSELTARPESAIGFCSEKSEVWLPPPESETRENVRAAALTPLGADFLGSVANGRIPIAFAHKRPCSNQCATLPPPLAKTRCAHASPPWHDRNQQRRRRPATATAVSSHRGRNNSIGTTNGLRLKSFPLTRVDQCQIIRPTGFIVGLKLTTSLVSLRLEQ